MNNLQHETNLSEETYFNLAWLIFIQYLFKQTHTESQHTRTHRELFNCVERMDSKRYARQLMDNVTLSIEKYTTGPPLPSVPFSHILCITFSSFVKFGPCEKLCELSCDWVTYYLLNICDASMLHTREWRLEAVSIGKGLYSGEGPVAEVLFGNIDGIFCQNNRPRNSGWSRSGCGHGGCGFR